MNNLRIVLDVKVFDSSYSHNAINRLIWTSHCSAKISVTPLSTPATSVSQLFSKLKREARNLIEFKDLIFAFFYSGRRVLKRQIVLTSWKTTLTTAILETMQIFARYNARDWTISKPSNWKIALDIKTPIYLRNILSAQLRNVTSPSAFKTKFYDYHSASESLVIM